MSRPAIVLLLVFSAFPAIAGCAAAPPPDARYQLDAQTRGKIVALMGEPFAVDLDRLYAEGRKYQALEYTERRRSYDPSTAITCLESRLKAEAATRKGISSENEFLACAYACSTEAGRPASPFHAEVEPHVAACSQGKLANEAPAHLKRFDIAAARVESETGALNKTYAMAEVLGALAQAKEGLGETDPRIAAAQAKATSLEDRYSAQLAKGRAFLQRPDVIDTRTRIDAAKAQVADFETKGMTAQLERAKGELHAAEAKLSFLISEAGL